MTSAADSQWEHFSAPAKSALRWAWASARVRSADQVDSIDLLIGIALADLTSSPAIVLLGHFGIPLGEVVARPNYGPPTAKALLAGWRPGEVPAFDSSDWIFFMKDPVPDGELWSLRFLFLRLLEEEGPASRAIRTAFSFRNIDFDEVVRAFREYVSSRTPLEDFLKERFRYQVPGVALPNYLADRPDQQADLVGIGPEVNAFAHLMASRRLVPPLAVGLFGAWGSGKSYFLRCLRSRIAQISDARLSAFHQAVVQVEFNAWQYVDGDLWASLIEHLFRNLRRSSDESDDLIADRQKFWVKRVQQANEAHQQAEQERLQLELDQRSAAEDVEARKEDLAEAKTRLAEAQQPRPSDTLKQAVQEVAKAAGLSEITDNAVKLAAELDQAKADLLVPLRNPKYLLSVVVALLVTPLVGYLAQQIDLSAAVSTVSWVLATAAVYANRAGRFLKRIADARAKLAEAEAEEYRRNEQALHEAQAKLDAVRAELDQAVTRERELASRVDEVRRAQDAETPGQVLTDFITDRTDSDDYRRHLGVPALVRRDLERLSQLVRQQVPGEYAIDRIVLYIDDLDRCPTPVVIKVLEAVHLLLAFPLFVVVVAVDARWLASSLRDHFQQLSGPDATPEDYLEKIFQVPFLIQPVSHEVRQRMLFGLLTPSLSTSTNVAEASTPDKERWPTESTAEFEAVVASFASTAGPREVLSDAVDLTITSAELQQARQAAEQIGSTPRAVKRFVNVYLLVKSIGAGRGLRIPEDGRLITLLATTLRTGMLPRSSDEDTDLTEWRKLIDRFRFPGERRSGAAGRMDG